MNALSEKSESVLGQPTSEILSHKADEEKMTVWGHRLKNISRAMLDVVGFGGITNYDDTQQRSALYRMNSKGEFAEHFMASMQDVGLAAATMLGAALYPEQALNIITGRILIGALTGLRREARLTATRRDFPDIQTIDDSIDARVGIKMVNNQPAQELFQILDIERSKLNE